MKVNNQTAVIIGGTGDAGRIPHSDDVLDNLPAIAGRKPITLADSLLSPASNR